VFQLFSHKNLYDDHHSDVQQSVAYPSNVAKRLHITERKIPPASSSPPPTVGVIDPDQRGARSLEAGLEEEGEIEELKMGLQTTIVLLIVVTVVCRWFISLTVPRSNRAK
jgi:Ca2+:H+ antiporter